MHLCKNFYANYRCCCQAYCVNPPRDIFMHDTMYTSWCTVHILQISIQWLQHSLVFVHLHTPTYMYMYMSYVLCYDGSVAYLKKAALAMVARLPVNSELQTLSHALCTSRRSSSVQQCLAWTSRALDAATSPHNTRMPNMFRLKQQQQ